MAKIRKNWLPRKSLPEGLISRWTELNQPIIPSSLRQPSWFVKNHLGHHSKDLQYIVTRMARDQKTPYSYEVYRTSAGIDVKCQTTGSTITLSLDKNQLTD